MAIYTRFGSPVTIISVEQDNQNTWLKVRLEDGEIREWAAYEFRADGGWAEIKAAMDAAPKSAPAHVTAPATADSAPVKAGDAVMTRDGDIVVIDRVTDNGIAIYDSKPQTMDERAPVKAAVKHTEAQLNTFYELLMETNLSSGVETYHKQIGTPALRAALVKKGWVAYGRFASGQDNPKTLRLNIAGREFATKQGWWSQLTTKQQSTATPPTMDKRAESGEFEEAAKPEVKVCPRCNGAKKIVYAEMVAECPTCDGTGYVTEAATPTPTASDERAAAGDVKSKRPTIGDTLIKCEHGVIVPYCAECYKTVNETPQGKTYQANVALTQLLKRQSENRRLDEPYTTTRSEWEALQAALSQTRAQLAAARGALEFYANKDNYMARTNSMARTFTPVLIDSGKRASQALNAASADTAGEG